MSYHGCQTVLNALRPKLCMNIKSIISFLMKLSSMQYHINLRLRKWDSQRLVRSSCLTIQLVLHDLKQITKLVIGSLVAQWGKTLPSTLEKLNTFAASMDPPKPKLT